MTDFISIAYALTVTAGGLLGYVRAGWFISYIIISLKIKINVLTSGSVLLMLCHFDLKPQSSRSADSSGPFDNQIKVIMIG